VILADLLSRLQAADGSTTPLEPSVARRVIGSVHYRSTEVAPGGLFVAIKGFSADGHDFIADAVARGAAAVVSQRPVPTTVPVIQVKNTRKALALIAARFYGHPARKVHLTGITGTNGKTTVSYLVESILAAAGLSCGVIGTVNYRYAGQAYPTPVTTPESLDLQRILARMHEAGVSHVVMEVSSHALDLFRVEGCRFDLAVFTNLTQDHLDYHGDLDSYWHCKKKLFHDYLAAEPGSGGAAAVVNGDDGHGRELFSELALPKLSFGTAREAMIRPELRRCDQDGIEARIHTPQGGFEVESALVGRHNLENILAAAGVGVGLGLPLATVAAGINRLRCVPGRLESVANSMGRFVYVDYAHTPDALENVLSALRPLCKGRLICVFGCGGDRDRGKRPLMGEIAARLSDLALATSDNPRSEDPQSIITQILPGLRKVVTHRYGAEDLAAGIAEKGYAVEPDRKIAIRLAVTASRPGDTILIAGKGHENYQIIGGKTVPFDDREQARLALAVQPPPDAGL
jgi:UDP-N-acetylmuramoyl-L-alanyl-D-glutamate--2,6-diaminopimelate ligase